MRFVLAMMAAAALTAGAADAAAQTVDIPAGLAEGRVPAAPGTGVQAMFVLSFFAGSPYSLAHARDILAGTSITPAFDAWCGPLAQVDFSNGTTADSLGRESPTVRCLPFQDPLAEQMHPCLRIPELPAGRYATSGGAAMRLRGWFAVRAAGSLTFAWGHDDGMAFDVGNVAVFAYPDSTAPRVDRRVLRFAAPGLYPFQLDWFDGGGNALLDWYVAEGEHPADEAPDAGLAAAGFHLMPASDLYPSGALPCTADCRRCEFPTPRCDYGRARCVACADDRDCARGTRCADGACAAPVVVDAGIPDAGVPDAGVVFDAAADATTAAVDGGGCACAAGRSRGARPGALGAMVGLAAALRRRRRERTRGRR